MIVAVPLALDGAWMVSLKYENRMTLVEAATAAQPARDNAQDQVVRDFVGRIERSLEALWRRERRAVGR